MPSGKCRLCGSDAELQLSHILPAFVFRWLKETSGTGHLRHGEAPNLRVQDGKREYWLCSECESLFSRDERAFAEQLFYPYSNRQSSQFVYGEWLLRFCVSVSWRVLHFYREKTHLRNCTPDAIEAIDAAEARWKAFLLGREQHPDPFEQHLVPFEEISSMSFPNTEVSPNLNRYLMRTVDMDICRGEKSIYVYSKLGRFAIEGLIREENRHHWQGTKVNVKTGVIEPSGYSIPKAFFNYVNSQARRTAELYASISERQSEKIDKSFRANIEKYIESDEFLAMQNDVRMFGDAAFTRRQTLKDSEK